MHYKEDINDEGLIHINEIVFAMSRVTVKNWMILVSPVLNTNGKLSVVYVRETSYNIQNLLQYIINMGSK